MTLCPRCNRPEGDEKGHCYRGRYREASDDAQCQDLYVIRLEDKGERLEQDLG